MSDDIIVDSTKIVQHSIKNISRNIKAVFYLAPEMYITKETKWYMSCHSHDNSYATGPVLIKTKIPRFYLKLRIIHSWLIGRDKMGTMCVASKTLWVGKRLEPKVLPWQQHRRCHSVSFVMHISDAKVEENYSRPIFLVEIFLIQCFTVQVDHSVIWSWSKILSA